MTDCSGDCRDTQNDPDNCGGCDLACSTDHGTRNCTSGSCQMTSCSTGYQDCSESENVSRNGCETHVAEDVSNCGQCGKVCPNDWANSSPTCAAGNCGHACTSPWDNCDGLAYNGCETNLDTSSTNCGTCGKTCASTVCQNRTCLTTARYGNTGAGVTYSNFSGNYLAGIQVYIPNACVTTGLGVVLYGATASRNMYLGLYRDVAGNPEERITTVASPSLVAPGGRELTVPQVKIPAGNYWLLGVWDGTASFAANSTQTVTWRYASHPYGPLPETAPTSMLSTEAPPPNLYAIVAQ